MEWEFAGISGYEPPSLVPSPGFRQPIEEAGGQHDQFADQLVGALRDVSVSLITSDLPAASGFISRWLSDRLLVFRRLGFHLLAEHGTELGELRNEAVGKEHLELSDCYHEYRAFLKSQFRYLPEDQRRNIEDWILSI